MEGFFRSSEPSTIDDIITNDAKGRILRDKAKTGSVFSVLLNFDGSFYGNEIVLVMLIVILFERIKKE